MEESDVIARAAADLRGLAGVSDERSDVASAARQLKAYELVLQLCRQLKRKRTDAGAGVMPGGAYSRRQRWFWDRPKMGGAILLRPELSIEQHAFANTHEPGHYLLHRGEGLALHTPCDETQINEQADWGGKRHHQPLCSWFARAFRYSHKGGS